MPFRRPGERRGFGRQRKERRQPGFKTASPKSGFMDFFKEVAGSPASEAEIAKAIRQVARFKPELDKPNTSEQRMREIYDQVSTVYLKIIRPQRVEHEIGIITGHVGIKPTDCIASICSGPGVLEAFFAKKIVPQGKVTCIDISPRMNAIAERVKAKAQAENMDIVTASGAATGLPTSSQDKVLAMQTDLPKTIHWQPFINEVKRVLKKGPDARFVFSFAAHRQSDIEEVLENLGKNHFRFTPIRYMRAGKFDAIIVIARYDPFGLD